MKKKVLMMAAALITTATYAQDLTSKKGEVILPESGDWAIGFDAAPFLDYAGNLFNSGNTAPTAQFLDSNMLIYGKYFVDAQTAYRARLRIGFGSHTETTFVPDATSADPTDVVEDDVKNSYSAIGIGVGYEKRRGTTRLQGVYGGELLVGFGGSSTEYTYGNDLADTGGGARVTEEKGGSRFMLGIRGFIGVEYFLFPKISIAAEYGWGLAMTSIGESEMTVEVDGAEDVTTKTSTKNSAFGIDTDNNGGQIRLMLHF